VPNQVNADNSRNVLNKLDRT